MDIHSPTARPSWCYGIGLAIALTCVACGGTDGSASSHDLPISDAAPGDTSAFTRDAGTTADGSGADVTSGQCNNVWSNEPAGFTLFSDQKWDVPSGWATVPGDTNTTLTTLADAPCPDKPVLQYTFPSGMLGGGAGGTPGANGADWYAPTTSRPTEVFIGLWVKIASPYQTNGAKVQKFFYIRDTEELGPAIFWLELYGTPGVDARINLVNQMVPPSERYEPNVTSTPLELGVWYKYEMVFKLASTNDAADGIAKVWVDGVLNINRSDIPTHGANVVKISDIDQDMQWGGTWEAKTQTDSLWVTLTRISGR